MPLVGAISSDGCGWYDGGGDNRLINLTEIENLPRLGFASSGGLTYSERCAAARKVWTIEMLRNAEDWANSLRKKSAY
jgi:hypothetical protein